MWHERYSLPYTKVLGFVACRVTSKNGGIGVCERNWGDVKQIASGKRFSLSGASIEKRAIIYTTACVKESRIKKETMEYANLGEVGFNDDDLNFDANLGKLGVSVAHLKGPSQEKRRFEAWMTPQDKIWWKDNNKVAEEHLAQKFKGLHFYFPEKDAMYKVSESNIEWKGRDG